MNMHTLLASRPKMWSRRRASTRRNARARCERGVKTLEGATCSYACEAGCANTIVYLQRENVAFIDRAYAPNSPDLNMVDYAICGCRNESTKAGSSTPMIKRSFWSGAHSHGASLITTTVNGDVVCSVQWIRMADTMNTRFTNCL